MSHRPITLTLLNSLKSRRIRYPILLIFLGLGLFILAREAHRLKANDFIEYWSASRILMAGGNPYSPAELLSMEQQGVPSLEQPKILYNPPWMIPIVLIFGLISYPISQLAWLLIFIALLLFCAQQLWRFYQGSPQKKWLAWIAVFVFAPTISVLEKGQITPLLLLGITGFIYFSEFRRNDWAAGACLALVSIKPQLIYLFWIAVLFWVIQQRRWFILLGTAGTILILTLITMIFNPSVMQQYFSAMQTYQISEWATPTIGSYLRFFWLGTDKFWLQFLPAFFGGLWLIYYWYKHQQSWRWVKDLPIVLLVSLLTSPYAWTYDQVILVPAVIQATIWLLNARNRWSTLLLASLYLGINILNLGLHMRLSDFWFVWMVPVLLIWYLLADRFKSPMKIMLPA